jgi:PAS domain S-box-containing protein
VVLHDPETSAENTMMVPARPARAALASAPLRFYHRAPTPSDVSTCANDDHLSGLVSLGAVLPPVRAMTASRESHGQADPARAVREDEPAELYRLLVASVRDYAIFALDARGHVLTWNAGAESVKGYRAHEIIGRHFSTFYPPEEIAAGKPEMELVVAARDGRFEDEGWRLRKDGSRFWANVIVTALRDDTGTVVGFAKVTRDLTERRAAQEQAVRLAAESAARAVAEVRSQELDLLNQTLQEQAMELEAQTEEAKSLAEELEQTNHELEDALEAAESARESAERASRAKSDFLAVMSHELRTPLNAIGGHTQILEMGLHGPVTDGQREALERIGRAQRHLLGLINNVLNLARIETGHIEYRIRPVLVSSVLADLASLVQPQFAARQITLVSRLPVAGDAGIHVAADREKLIQILTNLLGNAAKFTPPRGEVEMRLAASPNPELAVIEVRDSGPGIPPDKLELIFEPFVQLERSLTQHTEGAGLGLAISRDLARGMGGDLHARNEHGQGATLVLSLRRAAAPAGRDP